MTTSEVPTRRRCSCGRYLAPLANGTAPRHTREVWSAAQHRTVRVRCHGTGKVFSAVARQRNLARSLSAVHDGFDAAARRMNDRARTRALENA